jgi:hypothetical protein
VEEKTKPSTLKEQGLYNPAMLAFALPFIYCAIFFLLFVIRAGTPANADLISFTFFVAGVLLGYSIIVLDRLIHALYLFPETEFSKLVQEQWQKKSLSGLARVLNHAGDFQQQLMTRSGLFLVCYLVLAVFVLTSTGSILGIGVIMGMGLRYTLDFWLLSRSPDQFIRQFFWQVKHNFTAQEVRAVVLGWTVFFLIISLLVLR